jgi:GTP pyrophosphokinase
VVSRRRNAPIAASTGVLQNTPLDWLNAQEYPGLDVPRIIKVAARLAEMAPEVVQSTQAKPPSTSGAFDANAQTDDLAIGSDIAELAAQLNLDNDSILAGLVYHAVRAERLSIDQATDLIGTAATQLLRSVLQLATTSLLETHSATLQTNEARDQLANVRSMLIAMINDVRVAVLKLAERVVALRWAKEAAPARQQRIARETELVFAPLASRLGIRQLKWELEDLALRYLDPQAYHDIAGQLDGRRSEREARVVQLAQDIESRLHASGLDATVQGRAKHIYSIWRKMTSKKLSFEQVYDVSAVRILVPDIAQCYTALGMIHTQWTHIPSEFDDYIAMAKDNGYQSIHTAVTDTRGRTLEVQIRTHEMHHEAELGVCAHWAYKSDEAGVPEAAMDEQPYAEKMDWMRQALEMHEASSWTQDLKQLLSAQIREQRLFVYTPKGHVIDLAAGATPVDFAYRLHTSIGHQCCGARVDGQPVALNEPLKSGQRVEIVTDKDRPHMPLRWLEPHLKVATTARAQGKIRDALRALDDAQLIREGEAMVRRLLQRLGSLVTIELTPKVLARVCVSLGYLQPHDLWLAVGRAEFRCLLVVEAILGLQEQQLSLLPEFQDDGEGSRLQILAANRDGLLRDVALLLSRHEVGIISSNARADSEQAPLNRGAPTRGAVIEVEVRESNLLVLAQVLDLLAEIPSVTDTNCA